MKNKLRKTAIVLVIIFGMLIFGNSIFVEAANVGDWKSTDQFDAFGTNDGGVKSTTQNIVATIINVVRIVGTGAAIIMLTYVAIKYMSAAPQEKAEFKKSAMAYVVGAIVLFAATNILGIIANFASSNITTT